LFVQLPPLVIIRLKYGRKTFRAIKSKLVSGRDFVYSLSNDATFEQADIYAQFANARRPACDIRDNWMSISDIGFAQGRWGKFGRPGHWNDPDMLVVGKVGWGSPQPTKLTPNE
jgi:alpha-galactosidase